MIDLFDLSLAKILPGKDGDAEPECHGVIPDSYDWKSYASYMTPAADTHLMHDQDNGSRSTDRCVIGGGIYIPAGKKAVIYPDVEGLQIGGWRTTSDGFPYQQQPNWGRGWENAPVTIDNRNGSEPYVFVVQLRYPDDREFTTENIPKVVYAKIT